MATNGNGNGHAHPVPREDDDSDTDSSEGHVLPLPSSPLEIAEYVREAIEGGRRMAGDLSALREELRKAWREQAETNGIVLSSLARQERQSQQTHALSASMGPPPCGGGWLTSATSPTTMRR